MNIKKLSSILLVAIVGIVNAIPKTPFFEQNESSQHFLFEKGKQFRLFEYNMYTWGQGAEWNNKEKLTETPCLRLNDESDQTAGHLRQQNPMWIAPCTEYRLTFMCKVDKVQGSGPFVEFILHDYNTDNVASHKYPLDIPGPTQEWTEKQFALKTDYLTRELIIQFSSDINGTCDVYFDKVYLKQVSEAGALMPTPIILMQNGSATLQKKKLQKQFKQVKLPIIRDYYRLSFDVAWDNYDGNTTMYIEWTGEYGDIVGKDYCDIYKIEGIQPNGNGIATRWKSEIGNKNDKARYKLDWHFNRNANSGQSSVERVMKSPTGARYAKIYIVSDDSLQGNLQINNLSLIAEY
jgi:hypothetical protein